MVTLSLPQLTVHDLARELDEKYLDWAGGGEDSIYNMYLNPQIGVDELDEALFWREHARGTEGIFGLPGVGKTLLLTATGLKISHYFMRPVVSDYHVKQAFIDEVRADASVLAEIKAKVIRVEWVKGLHPELSNDKALNDFIAQMTTSIIERAYTYIDEDTILKDMQEIDKLARNKDMSTQDKMEWVVGGKGSNGVKLHGATLLISEIDRWVNCRRTGTSINSLITDLFKRWRHYDILVAGDCVDKYDLDRQRIVPRFSCIVYPHPLGNHQFEYLFKSVQRLTKGGVIHQALNERIDLDGREFYGYYQTQNPIALEPTFRLRESKEKKGNN